jgi:DNA (cytosine-5)-methyltransferase 1
MREGQLVGAVQIQLPLCTDSLVSVAELRRKQLSFDYRRGKVCKTVCREDGSAALSAVKRLAFSGDPAADFDLSWLRTRSWPSITGAEGALRVADLFSGCGGMSLGLFEACRNLQRPVEFAFAAELDPIKAEVYSQNFTPTNLHVGPLELVLDGDLGAAPTGSELGLVAALGRIDVLLGGPPCQGHSDLNNHTRRKDVRNGLFTRMGRFVELFSPEYVVIENVQGVRHDLLRSASATAAELVRLGYEVEEVIVDCASLGVPQTRRRYMLVASRNKRPGIRDAIARFKQPPRSVGWALFDLLDSNIKDVFNTAAVHAPENERRIRFLFDNDLYDLPDDERPTCHRTKVHSYKSVYGRMRWELPAPTITTGFGSTGQGRFVHPFRQRTLTPHEAARLQTFPDFFKFGDPGRTQLQKMIGNSVPPLAMSAVALGLLR